MSSVLPTVAIAVVALLVLTGTCWAGWTRLRLRRLHRRVAAARSRVVTELARRRALVAELVATERQLSAPSRDLLLGLVARGRSADDDRFDVEEAESALTRALALVLAESSTELDRWRHLLIAATRRVHFARRFHNDLAIAARSLARHRCVRWWWPQATAPACLAQIDDPALLQRRPALPYGSSGVELDQRSG